MPCSSMNPRTKSMEGCPPSSWTCFCLGVSTMSSPELIASARAMRSVQAYSCVASSVPSTTRDTYVIKSDTFATPRSFGSRACASHSRITGRSRSATNLPRDRTRCEISLIHCLLLSIRSMFSCQATIMAYMCKTMTYMSHNLLSPNDVQVRRLQGPLGI